MESWTRCVVLAAAVGLCQRAVRADFLTVADPIFSKTLVPYSWQASTQLAPNTWSTYDPNPQEYPKGSGILQNVNAIVWQNPLDYKRVDNLISDPTVTLADVNAIDPTPAQWDLPYQGCASIGAQSGAEFFQILSSTFQANKGYRLTVAVGHNFDGGNPDFSPAPTAELKIELFWINAGISGDYLLPLSADVFNDAATGLSGNHLLDFSTPVNFIAPGDKAVGKSIGILITSPATGTANGFFNFTNVRVEEVPEPATLGIMLVGSALLFRRRRA